MNDTIYQMVTDRIVSALEAGTVPWHQPWTSAAGLPLSMSTGKPYRGINLMLLGIVALDSGYASPFWGTYKHINELGGQVRKGEHATIVTFWGTARHTVRNDETGQDEQHSYFILRYYKVFNADQADGLPEKYHPQAPERTPFEGLEAAQDLINAYVEREHIQIHFGGSRANYSPVTDQICLPKPYSFDTTEDYYSTALHECGHSTGHKSRLNREGIAEFDHFGSGRYAKEELVAEITAAMTRAVAGISCDHTETNTAAYIANWLQQLRNDPKLIVQAAGQAQKAADLIRDIHWDDEPA